VRMQEVHQRQGIDRTAGKDLDSNPFLIWPQEGTNQAKIARRRAVWRGENE